MIRPIDEKIVVMKLDNTDFQRKAAETTTMFGKLSGSLNKVPQVNLGKTSNELGQIAQQTRGIKMETLANSVQMVAGRFTNLGVVATTALATITNKAVNAGMSITKSLTLDQVTSGFKEYELKIGSIGTVLANTKWAGTDLDDVKKTLEELNQYADNTVYNFGQMTQNIGRFTAAGVKLEDSAIAIKGLSNLAAISGSNTEQLNSAMYQMSQSMSSGKMNLMDWNSLVNAGMAGKTTQDALLKTAKAMGVTVDTTKTFRDSISDGWLSSEVFLETMKKFGNDKTMTEAATSVRTFTGLVDSLKESIGSGWATTWEHIFGDFEEATKFWTGMSTAIGDFFMKSAESRNKLLEGVAKGRGFVHIFEGLRSASKPIVQIFDALGDGWRRMFPPTSVDKILTLTKRFRLFTLGMRLSDVTVSRLITVFHGVFSVFSTVWEITKHLAKAFRKLIPEGAGGDTLKFLEKMAQLAIGFNIAVKEGNGLTKFIEDLGNTLGSVGKFVGGIFSEIFRIVGETFGITMDYGGSLKESLGQVIDWVKEKLAPLGAFIKSVFGDIGGGDIVGAGAVVGIFAIVGKIFQFFAQPFGILKSVNDLFAGISDAINNFSASIRYVNLLLIAVAIGILAVSLSKLDGIDGVGIAKGITALALSMGILVGGMLLLSKYDAVGSWDVSITLIALAGAVLLMAIALKKISDLNIKELGIGIGGLVVITAALAGAVIAISKWGKTMGTGALQLVALAGAVYIIAFAIAKLASINTAKLWSSIGALTVIFIQLAVFLKVVDKTKFSLGSALGIAAIAGSIHIMILAIERIAKIDPDVMVKGLTVITLILVQITLFSKLAKGPALASSGLGLLIIAGALSLLMGPMESLGKMSWKDLAEGLGAMAFALVALSGAAKLMNSSIAGAFGILVVAAALNVLMIPIKALGEMSWGDLLKAFVGLAGGLTLIALVSSLLAPTTPAILAFAGAILVLGAAVLAVGAGVALFGIGLTTLAALTGTSISSMMTNFENFMVQLTGLIGVVVKFVVDLAIALIGGIVAIVPRLAEAGATLIISLLTTITTYLPTFIDLGVLLITQLIDGIARSLDPLVTAGMNLMLSYIDALTNSIRDNGPKLISAFLELLGEVLLLFVEAGTQVVTAMWGWIPGVKTAASNVGSNAEKYIRDNFGAKDAAQDKGDEFVVGLNSKEGWVKKAGENLGKAGKDGAGSIKMGATGGDFAAGFAGGINNQDTISKVRSAASSIAKAAAGAVRGWLQMRSPSRLMRKDGGFFTEGFALGIIDKAKMVAENAKGLASTASTSLNKFLEGFDPGPEDNEIHFKAVVDYDGFNPGVGRIPVSMSPDTSFASGLVSNIKGDRYRSKVAELNKTNPNQTTKETETVTKQPAVIQVVTPDRREMASWLVDDITEFQDFKMATMDQF